MIRDISIDLETLSLRPNAMILQIGTVIFDPTKVQSYKEIFSSSPSLSLRVAQQGQVENYGRHRCPQTEAWWASQDVKTIASVYGTPDADLPEALNLLSLWIKRYSEIYTIGNMWIKGSKDAVWLEDAYDALNMKFPLHYRTVRCVRSVGDIVGVPQPVVPNAAPHNALSDALVQAMRVQSINNKIERWKANEHSIHVSKAA